MAARYGTDFTTGSIPKKLLLFSLPFMASNMLQVVYQMVDMIIVGNFVGSNAMAAVNTSGLLIAFFTMMCTGYEYGAQVYLSQLIGAGRREKLNEAIGTVFSTTIIMGIVVTLIVLLGGRHILNLMSTPPESYQMALDYLLICGGLIVFTFGYNLVSTLQRAQGDSKHPLIFILVASLINVVLDLLFTGYLGWGTRGAAAATVIGQAVSFFAALCYLYRRRDQFGFDFKLSSFRINRGVFAEVAKLGSANIVQLCLIYFSVIFVTTMVNRLGVSASATLAVGNRIDDVIAKITMAIYVASSAVIAQNFAAGKLDRVRRTVHFTWLFCGICYAIYVVVYLTHYRQIFGLFTDDASVIDLAPLWVRATIVGSLGVVTMRGTNGLIQGTGFVTLNLVCGIADGLVVRVGMSYLLGTVMGMGLYGYFLGFIIPCYATALPGLIYYLSDAWKRRKLVIDE